MSFQEKLAKYADLAVRVGAGVKKDQEVIVNAPINCYELARLVTAKAYEAGAKRVVVEYGDQHITHALLKNASEEVLSDFPQWRVDGLLGMIRKGAAIISIVSADPELMMDVEPKKMGLFQKAAALASEEYKNYVMQGNTCWTIVAHANAPWAKKVFPKLEETQAIDALWDKIFEATRMHEPDPVKAWENHLNLLDDKLELLNGKNFVKFHYKAPGTDLVVGMPESHKWIGGGQVSLTGDKFLPNIPTEEVFSTPHKYQVDGTLASTKPLVYGGKLIENFSFTFEKGKVVDYKAEVGQDALANLFATDEGSMYLGEIAIVPHDSPISNTNVTFFNTLFDENASCHFAFGNAYLLSVEDADKHSKEKLDEMGVNLSLSHVDFMVGSGELNITGTTASGEEIIVFDKGNWKI